MTSSASDMTQSAYLVQPLSLENNETLIDRTQFTVSTQQFEAFVALLGRPEKANAGLENLFAFRAPWDCESPPTTKR